MSRSSDEILKQQQYKENTMRQFIGMLAAGGLLFGMAIAANAQSDAVSASGAYPAGITTGSAYGGNWSGFYGLNPGGVPLNTYNQAYNANGANYSYMLPGANSATNLYRSAYVNPGTTSAGYAPGTTYAYGSGVPAYGYGTQPVYTTTYPGYSYGSTTSYYTNTYGARRGLFGNIRRRVR